MILRHKLVDFYRQQARRPVALLADSSQPDPDEAAGPLFGADGHWPARPGPRSDPGRRARPGFGRDADPVAGTN